MIHRPDVSVATGEDELQAEFGSIVERYAAVRSDLEAVKSERPTGEDDGFTGKVFLAEESTERWRDRHPEHVTEVTQLLEDYQAVFEQVDIDIEDPDAELTEGSDSGIGALLDEVIDWKTILEPTEE